MLITITGSPQGVQGPSFPANQLHGIQVKAKIVHGKAIVTKKELAEKLIEKNLQSVAEYWKHYILPTFNFADGAYVVVS
jgi:hypothetical protein